MLNLLLHPLLHVILCLYFFDSGKTKVRVTGNIGVEMNL